MRKPERESLLCADYRSETLASRKGDSSDAISEVSGTTAMHYSLNPSIGQLEF